MKLSVIKRKYLKMKAGIIGFDSKSEDPCGELMTRFNNQEMEEQGTTVEGGVFRKKSSFEHILPYSQPKMTTEQEHSNLSTEIVDNQLKTLVNAECYSNLECTSQDLQVIPIPKPRYSLMKQNLPQFDAKPTEEIEGDAFVVTEATPTPVPKPRPDKTVQT